MAAQLAELVEKLEAKYDLTDSERVKQAGKNVAHLQD